MHGIKHPERSVTIGIVGKYIHLRESYKSLNEALIHGGVGNNAKVRLEFIDSEKIEKGEGDDNPALQTLREVDGILVPGGFGSRGIEGKIQAIRYARENKVPFLGICLGMQMAVVEFARNVADMPGANSTEFDTDSPYPVIYLMTEWFDYQQNATVRRSEHSDKVDSTSNFNWAHEGDGVVTSDEDLDKYVFPQKPPGSQPGGNRQGWFYACCGRKDQAHG